MAATSKKNKLHALFNSDPEVLHRADRLVGIEPWRYSSTPTRINTDNSITYSWEQWVFFQRLDPVLRPAMDTLKNIPLQTPLEKFSIPFVKNGFLDEKGILKYK